jgi:hypothetical protein
VLAALLLINHAVRDEDDQVAGLDQMCCATSESGCIAT